MIKTDKRGYPTTAIDRLRYKYLDMEEIELLHELRMLQQWDSVAAPVAA